MKVLADRDQIVLADEQNMKTETVTVLRYHFPKIEALLRKGETVRITKRGCTWGYVRPVGKRKKR